MICNQTEFTSFSGINCFGGLIESWVYDCITNIIYPCWFINIPQHPLNLTIPPNSYQIAVGTYPLTIFASGDNFFSLNTQNFSFPAPSINSCGGYLIGDRFTNTNQLFGSTSHINIILDLDQLDPPFFLGFQSNPVQLFGIRPHIYMVIDSNIWGAKNSYWEIFPSSPTGPVIGQSGCSMSFNWPNPNNGLPTGWILST